MLGYFHHRNILVNLIHMSFFWNMENETDLKICIKLVKMLVPNKNYAI